MRGSGRAAGPGFGRGRKGAAGRRELSEGSGGPERRRSRPWPTAEVELEGHSGGRQAHRGTAEVEAHGPRRRSSVAEGAKGGPGRTGAEPQPLRDEEVGGPAARCPPVHEKSIRAKSMEPNRTGGHRAGGPGSPCQWRGGRVNKPRGLDDTRPMMMMMMMTMRPWPMAEVEAHGPRRRSRPRADGLQRGREREREREPFSLLRYLLRRSITSIQNR